MSPKIKTITKVPSHIAPEAGIVYKQVKKASKSVPQSLNEQELIALTKALAENKPIPKKIKAFLERICTELGKKKSLYTEREIIKETILRHARQNTIFLNLFGAFKKRAKRNKNISFDDWFFISKSKELLRLAKAFFGDKYKLIMKNRIKIDKKLLLQTRTPGGHVGEIIDELINHLQGHIDHLIRNTGLKKSKELRTYIYLFQLNLLRANIGELISALTLKELLAMEKFKGCKLYWRIKYTSDSSKMKEYYDFVIMNPSTKKIMAVIEVKTYKNPNAGIRAGLKQHLENQERRNLSETSQDLHRETAFVIDFDDNGLKITKAKEGTLSHQHFLKKRDSDQSSSYSGFMTAERHLVIPAPPTGYDIKTYKKQIQEDIGYYCPDFNIHTMKVDDVDFNYTLIDLLALKLAVHSQ